MSQSRISLIDVNIQNKKTQIKIHPESPRTVEACKELGIEPDYFIKLKALESFADPHIKENIQKMRYNHYMDRVGQTSIEVLRKRREIIRKEMISQQLNTSSLEKNEKTMESMINLPNKESKKVFRSTGNNISGIPEHIANSFNKTLSYFRMSHDSPIKKKNESTIIKKDNINIEVQLEEEKEKFNKLKFQKQKEAKFLYDEEIRRLKIVEEIKEKEKRLEEYRIFIKKKKEMQKEESRKAAQEKIEQIRDIERKFLESKKEERQKIKQKNEELRSKRQKENEENLKLKEENRKKYLEKRQLIEEKIREHSRIQDELTWEKYNILNQKLDTSQELYYNHLMDIINKRKEKSEREKLNLQKYKQYRMSEEQKNISKVIEKLFHQEKTKEIIINEKIKREKIKENQEKEKKLHFYQMKNNVKVNEFEKINEYKEKLKKIESNLDLKKKNEEGEIKMKQEFRRLKEKDKLENYDRNRRRNLFVLEKLLLKEKLIEEKLKKRKIEEDLLKKAKTESALHSKIERERIFTGMKQITDILNTQKPNQMESLTKIEKEKGLKILKKILNEDELNISIFQEPLPIDPLNPLNDGQLDQNIKTIKSKTAGGPYKPIQ